MSRAGLVLGVMLGMGAVFSVWAQSEADESQVKVPKVLHCSANQTAGFHDFANTAESYEPVAFYEGEFTLKINRALMRHRDPADGVDLYVTVFDEEDQAELSCRYILGVGGDPGISCTNAPPSELVLINTKNLRYTRTSIGGWTFASARHNEAGDSIYVEYGSCRS